MAGITIGIVASAREWRSVLQAHVRDHVADVKVQILREPRMALELDLNVVVIDDVTSFLTRDKVVRLREKGTRVVGIYDPEGNEGLGITFLENLGVDLTLPSTISPEEMINAVSQLQPRENYSHTFDHIVADYSTGATVPVQTGDSSLVAVGGPPGTGSTEVAIALADVLVARRSATLLLDADEVGPSVARRLGFQLHPNILSAIDTVSNVTRPLTEMVGRPGDRVANSVNFDVIPGIANPEDWAQLRSMDLEDLFTAARKSWRYIICNTGPFAEDLSGYGIERFGSTRTTLNAADVVIGVMNATPTGYLRFLDWLAAIRTVGTDKAVFVVVNRAPKSNYIRAEIENQLAKDVDARFFAGLIFVPEDDRVQKAEWEGQKVPRGPFMTSVAEVASYALPMDYSKKQRAAIQAQQYAQQTHANQNYANQYDTGYSAQVTVAGADVSWNDPDIANPPVQAYDSNPVAQPISLDDPPNAFFDSATPLDNDLNNLQTTLSETMPEVVQDPNQAQVLGQPHDSQGYSCSPPELGIDSFKVDPPGVQQPFDAQPSPAAQPQEQGYVPTFKKEEQVDSSVEFLQAPVQAPVDPAMYTNVETQETQNTEQQNEGYVPGFVEENNDDDDSQSFWSS